MSSPPWYSQALLAFISKKKKVALLIYIQLDPGFDRFYNVYILVYNACMGEMSLHQLINYSLL